MSWAIPRRLALPVVAALAGCASVPADRPLAPGAVTVEILERDVAAGNIRIAIENHTTQALAYPWPFTEFSATVTAGERRDPWNRRVDGEPLQMHERPLAAGTRQVLTLDCGVSNRCGAVGKHVGVLVCRREPGGCDDFELVWSRTAIAPAPAPAR